eukprot:2671708-Rhodomonas_salina.1
MRGLSALSTEDQTALLLTSAQPQLAGSLAGSLASSPLHAVQVQSPGRRTPRADASDHRRTRSPPSQKRRGMKAPSPALTGTHTGTPSHPGPSRSGSQPERSDLKRDASAGGGLGS